MGLGPAVCEKCQVLARYSEEGVPTPDQYTKISRWVCPICGNPTPKDSAGFDPARFKKLEANEKFLRFMTNKYKEI